MNKYPLLVLRLVTGEDIIAETAYLNEAGNSRYMILNPLKIVYLPATKDTMITLSLMQWMFTRISENQCFEMNDRNVLFTTDPAESLAEYYYKTVEYFHAAREKQQRNIAMGEDKLKNSLYEELAMSDDDVEEDMIDEDTLQELKDFLARLGKKDDDTLH